MNRCFIGDCRDVMRELIAQGVKVNTCVTSPPYWGLRDYGVDGQLGLESTPDEYVQNMVEVFRLVRDLLADDGTLWLNLGDSYVANRGNTAEKPGYDNKAAKGGADLAIRKHKITGPGLKEKDLVGIPWRVAFALQAPYYHGRIKQERDRAWLAGLADGEGCITILEAKSPHGSGSSYPPVLQVRMCDVECIEHAARITGYGTDAPMIQEPPSQPGQRGAYQWRLHGRKAADIIAEIYPYLLIKRKQAIVAWNHQAVRDGYETKRGVKIPADALEKQIACRDLIQRLNRRESVDIPDWMIEPPTPYGQGWYLRQDVIWSKPNPMPESVRDRCTKAHEYIFLLSKRERYYFDAPAIAEPVSPSMLAQLEQGYNGQATKDYEAAGAQDASAAKASIIARAARASWRGSDFGGGKTGEMMETCGHRQRKPAGWDTGKGGHGSYHREGRAQEVEYTDATSLTRNKRSVWTVTTKPYAEAHFATFPPDLIEPCILAGSKPGDIVLDPFFGSGTTGEVAQRLGRQWIGCELNAQYEPLQARRTAQQGLTLT